MSNRIDFNTSLKSLVSYISLSCQTETDVKKMAHPEFLHRLACLIVYINNLAVLPYLIVHQEVTLV